MGRSLIQLAHPLPSLATVAAALVFMALLARGAPPGRSVALIGVMLLLQQVAISVHNDWCDRVLDATAKPWRAIPSGAISAATALRWAYALAALSLAVAVAINTTEAALDALGLAAGFAYNARLKRTWWSWLPFAVAFPLLPIFGAVALPGLAVTWQHVLVAYLGIAPISVAIHLADTLPDLATDAQHGLAGLAHRAGKRRSVRLIALLSGAGLVALALGLAATGGLPRYTASPTEEENTMAVYELRIYDAAPGRLADISARFRNHTMSIFKRHGIEVTEFWEHAEGDDGQLIYVCKFEDEARKQAAWDSFRADPEWQRVKAKTEANGPIVQKVTSILMRHTDYSPAQD